MAYLLSQLLTDTAARHPERVAVVCRDRRATYRELEALSNRLAQALRMRGIGRGDRVGICLPKSIESVVAVFGILKVGGAYVPLDPTAPVKRLAGLVAHGDMRALMTTRAMLGALSQELAGSSPLRCAVLTDGPTGAGDEPPPGVEPVLWGQLAAFPTALPSPDGLVEDDLAYILYTSGSTGEPKGVTICHRASLAFVNWAHEYFRPRPADRVSSHAPLHFDLSIFDLFVTIKAGASVVLVPEELSVFPIDLARFIEESGITIWYSVPSVLTRLVRHGMLSERSFSSLRKILFAGEVFPIKHLRQLRAAVSHAEYYNLYGPTETNVCTCYRLADLSPDRIEPLPIGKACAGAEVFAVTDRGALARPGEVGELYVSGPSLMTGYWRMPEKTSEVLVPHPAHPPGSREKAYRTGDLVTRDAEGNYLFLGRRDSMIKSRGYRIELGEIETVLSSHPQVEEVAVFAIPDEEIGNTIKAVVVPGGAHDLAQAEIRRFCAERLPRYMIPASIELRGSLRKTSTGKIDRSSLLRDELQHG